MRASRRFFLQVVRVWTRNPVLRSLPTHSQPQQCLSDRFDAHQVLGETLLEADFRGPRQGPYAGLFPIEARRLMQDGAQCFTFGLHRFRAGGLLPEAI